ncbi:MAG: alanine:cation symporter family protein [Bacteroidales bacterium]|nr:alanine:cation symporter family protein [Candidatus Cacconaster scatequi]
MIDAIVKVSDFLWTYVLIALLLGCAAYFTIRTRGVQFRMIPEMVRIMLGRDARGKGGMSSFKAFSVSLASRVGTGNLAGVASAIFIGGPGAVFWMWVTALLSAATGFMESTLAQLFKRRDDKGFYGGPAYYMETGLNARWMGVLFAVLITLTFAAANQTVQCNTITDSISSTFGIGKIWVAIGLAVISFIVVSGGIRRIADVTSCMVPFMAVGYILLAFWIIFTNINNVPSVFRLIVDSAFGIRQAAGGAVGAAIMQGVRRGLFSNEAGEGSAPNAAAIADTSHPVKQGLVQALGVFVDTLVICTCTALIILLSDVWDCGEDGIILTTHALESEVGTVGRYFITIAIFLFAFSSVIANYYYGETNLRFIGKRKWHIWILRLATPSLAFAGSMIELRQAWGLVDFTMALLTICNLTALVLLSPRVFHLLKDYRSQKKSGITEPKFKKDIFPDLKDKLEGWE